MSDPVVNTEEPARTDAAAPGGRVAGATKASPGSGGDLLDVQRAPGDTAAQQSITGPPEPSSGVLGLLRRAAMGVFAGRLALTRARQCIALAAFRGFVCALAREVSEQGVTAGLKELATPRNMADLVDDAEVPGQRGMRREKSLQELDQEAAEGRKFEKSPASLQRHSQVPIYDEQGIRRRLDHYDAAAGEIVSVKSLASTDGQVAFVDEFTMLKNFQEFPLKRPNGVRVVEGNLTGKIVTGRYVLEVGPQIYPIPAVVSDRPATGAS